MNKIKLKVPLSVAKYNDWSDDELLCLAFMFWCTKKEGLFTQYYLHTNDLMALIGKVNARNSYHHVLKRVRRIFHIGRINNHTSRFHYNFELLKDQRYNNKINAHEVYITDTKAIARWSYIVGRCGDPNLIYDHNKIYRSEGVSPQTIFWKQHGVNPWTN